MADKCWVPVASVPDEYLRVLAGWVPFSKRILRVQPVIDDDGFVVLPPWPSPSSAPKPAAEDYTQRRARLAAERNPRPTCDHSRFTGQWACFICGETGGTATDARSAGVARAVANLSRSEHRIGATRFMPEEG